jgi:methylenetetrahydrofolate dehydrogenase (NADP+)/methenyltetrahydrofolate cyclohydrolase
MILLNGKQIANEIQTEIAEKVTKRKAEQKKVPHLAAIIVGDDGGSLTYINAKIKACEKVGFESSLFAFKNDIREIDLLNKINELNNDENIDGYIVQLPLPKHIDAKKIILAIDPKKDVDGFHPENFGRMMQGLPCFIPATPLGILELLKRYNIETKGKHCVVVGRSNIVGLPMSVLLAQNADYGNATVTIAHSYTKNLKSVCLLADILIVAVGKPEFITAEFIKKGAVVVDVGIHRIENAKTKKNEIKGDVLFDDVAPHTSYISPVPGGVGPLTICGLLLNTLIACERK